MDFIRTRIASDLNPIYCSNPLEENKNLGIEIEKNILKVIRSGNYILGENVKRLEEDFANFIGTPYCIAVANGTDALSLSLIAMGIGEKDEVITVSHTAIATIAGIEITGAKAVLVDINKVNFTIDTSKIEEAISKKTKAIVVVHLYGHPAEMKKIKLLCKQYNLRLIEDVSQAHGAKFEEKFLGSIGDVGCFSCYPTKNLGACGDAGLITTKDIKLSNKIRMLRQYGWVNRVSQIPGQNSRMDEIQAAILIIKLKKLKEHNFARNKIANFYRNNLSQTPLELPIVESGCTHVYHQYVVKTKHRDKLKSFLEKSLIFPGIHYSLPVHKHPAYLNKILISGNLTNTELTSNQILSLPIYPGLEEKKCARVINEIYKFFGM